LIHGTANLADNQNHITITKFSCYGGISH